MISGIVRMVVYSVGLMVLGYLFFFIPLGQRTLFEHTKRIAATEEAQELGTELKSAAKTAEEHIRDEVGKRYVSPVPFVEDPKDQDDAKANAAVSTTDTRSFKRRLKDSVRKRAKAKVRQLIEEELGSDTDENTSIIAAPTKWDGEQNKPNLKTKIAKTKHKSSPKAK